MIRMAREAGWQYADAEAGHNPLWRFAALVAAAEREAIKEELDIALQADMENGVKFLSERAAHKFYKSYPALSEFFEWLGSRGQA